MKANLKMEEISAIYMLASIEKYTPAVI